MKVISTHFDDMWYVVKDGEGVCIVVEDGQIQFHPVIYNDSRRIEMDAKMGSRKVLLDSEDF